MGIELYILRNFVRLGGGVEGLFEWQMDSALNGTTTAVCPQI